LKITLVYNYRRIQTFKAGTEIEFAKFEVMYCPVLGLSELDIIVCIILDVSKQNRRSDLNPSLWVYSTVVTQIKNTFIDKALRSWYESHQNLDNGTQA